MSEIARARKKLLAIRRAEKRLQQRLETIDWEYDVLLPEVDKLNELAAQGQVPTYEVEAGDESQD